MEIHRIEICNLNSLKGEFCIDFMSGSLRGQDIFAITGTTGSGKSTILDAVTLALYNRVPRLDGKKGEKNPKSQDPYERLAPQDTENSLTRGQKKGYAKVVFEASGDMYRAEWFCELREKNFRGFHTLYRILSENGVEKAESIITRNLVNEFDANGVPKDKTVSKEVVGLIGLGYDQFCKACILAQNSFANFLKANDAEKADILERITGTSIYGRIADVIVKGYDDAVKAKTTIDDQISGQSKLLLNKVDLSLATTERNTLRQEQDQLTKEIERLKTGVTWWNELADLERKKTEAEARKNTAVENEQKLGPEQKRLERHEKLDQGIKMFDEETTARRVLENAEKDVAEAQKRLAENRKEIDDKTQEKSEAEKTLKQEQAELDKIAWVKPIKDNIALIRNEIKLLNKSVKDLRNAASKLASEGGYNQLGKKDLLTAINLLTAPLDPEWTSDTVRARLEKIRKELTLCENAETLYPMMEQVLGLDESDKTDEATIASLTPLQDELGNDVRALTDHINALQNQDFVYKRSLLVEGKPCELCGATSHPYATASAFNKEIDEARGQLKKKSDKKDEIDGKIDNARSGISFRNGQKNALNASIKDLKTRMAAADDSFRTIFQMYAVDAQIQALKKKASQRTERVEELDGTETNLSLIGLRDILQEADSHKETLGQYLPDSWYGQWLADEFKYSQTLEGDVKYYADKEDVVSADDKKVQKFRTAIQTLTDLIPGLENTIEAKKENRARKSELFNAAVEKLSAWIDTFNAGDETPVTREELDAQKKDTTPWARLRKTINDAENDRIQAATLSERAGMDLQEHLEKEDKPFEEKEKLEEQKNKAEYDLKGSDNSVEIRLAAVLGRLATHDAAEKEIAGYKEVLEAAKKEVALWERFYNMLGKSGGDKNAKEFRKLAQNYTLGLLLSYANEELGKFTKRYTLKKQNDNSLEIMVLDGELGERYASSLSGGETFMVSLALALGLSSISSGSVTLKNIFIDEGFGSLDGDTQKTVVGALNTLRTQGKRIGLISHTAALLGDDAIYKINVKKVDDKFSVIEME